MYSVWQSLSWLFFLTTLICFLRLIINKIIIKKNLPHSKITSLKLLSRFKLYLYANSQLRIKKNRPCWFLESKRTVPVDLPVDLDFVYISHSPINDPTRTAAALPVIFALSRSGFTSTNSALTSFSDLAISSNA